MRTNILNRKVEYKGVVYNGYRPLYNSVPASSGKVKFGTFYQRIKRGLDIDTALYQKLKVIYEIKFRGITFRSRMSLYTYLTQVCPGIVKDYGTMCEHIVKHPDTWQDTVVDKLREKKNIVRGFQKASREIGACNNLVWQRVNILGWSVKKARETPVDNVHKPIPVTYKGKKYKSITACFKAVKPPMSLPYFKRDVLKI